MIIKSCAHCGELEALAVVQLYDQQYRGECFSCGSTGPLEETWIDALEGWNRMVPRISKPIKVKAE